MHPIRSLVWLSPLALLGLSQAWSAPPSENCRKYLTARAHFNAQPAQRDEFLVAGLLGLGAAAPGGVLVDNAVWARFAGVLEETLGSREWIDEFLLENLGEGTEAQARRSSLSRAISELPQNEAFRRELLTRLQADEVFKESADEVARVFERFVSGNGSWVSEGLETAIQGGAVSWDEVSFAFTSRMKLAGNFRVPSIVKARASAGFAAFMRKVVKEAGETVEKKGRLAAAAAIPGIGQAVMGAAILYEIVDYALLSPDNLHAQTLDDLYTRNLEQIFSASYTAQEACRIIDRYPQAYGPFLDQVVSGLRISASDPEACMDRPRCQAWTGAMHRIKDSPPLSTAPERKSGAAATAAE